MKSKSFLFSLLLCVLVFASTAQNNERNKPIMDTSQHWGLFLSGGASFYDHTSLNSLISSPTIYNKPKYATYIGGGLSWRINWDQFYIIVGAQNAHYYNNINNDENLSIRHTYGSFGFGYGFIPIKKMEIIPHGDFLFGGTQIIYTKASSGRTGTHNYLSGAADTYRLRMDRLYARIGVSTTYRVNMEFSPAYFPVTFGLDLEYIRAVSDSHWKDGVENNMSGPQLFDQSFYAGIAMGWWL